MAKNKKQYNSFADIFKPQKHLGVQTMSQNNARKNNMNYTNINKNRGK